MHLTVPGETSCHGGLSEQVGKESFCLLQAQRKGSDLSRKRDSCAAGADDGEGGRSNAGTRSASIASSAMVGSSLKPRMASAAIQHILLNNTVLFAELLRRPETHDGFAGQLSVAPGFAAGIE